MRLGESSSSIASDGSSVGEGSGDMRSSAASMAVRVGVVPRDGAGIDGSHGGVQLMRAGSDDSSDRDAVAAMEGASASIEQQRRPQSAMSSGTDPTGAGLEYSIGSGV